MADALAESGENDQLGGTDQSAETDRPEETDERGGQSARLATIL